MSRKSRIEEGPAISLGGILSAMSALSEYQEYQKANKARDEGPRRRRFEFPKIGQGAIFILALVPVLYVTIAFYVDEAKRDSERTYEQLTVVEYANPTKKQTATLVKDILFKEAYTFKDDFGREFWVFDDYCVVEYDGDHLGGASLESAILWNQGRLGLNDKESTIAFIEASRAAVGG